VVTQLNEALLKKADAAHLVKLDKVRADTTVVPANVAYPTDSGLLAKGVTKLARTVWSLKQMGFAARTCFRDRTRSVRRRAHSIGAWLRRRNDEAKTEVLAITGELADLAEATITDALAVARNAKRSLVPGRPRRARRSPSSQISSRQPSSWNRSSPKHAPGS
jgi:IS5 family transposase